MDGNPYRDIFLGLPWTADRYAFPEPAEVASAVESLCDRRPDLAPLLAPVNHGVPVFEHQVRGHCRKTFGYAVPTPDAIAAIVEAGPRIVEVGAGTGYWAALLAAAGAEVTALDNGSWKLPKLWHEVRRGTPEALGLVNADCLLLCWPPYQTSMASRALARFRGPRVAYVGEGEGGCTADDRFHDTLRDEWNELRQVSIPQWPGLHDRLWIYERRESA